MNPKTFQISFNAPVSSQSYLFYLHAESKEAALEWVEQTLPGIDTEPTRRRWALPPANPPRIGNSDPVRILDLDLCSRTVRYRSSAQVVCRPEGYYRVTEAQVQAGMVKIFEQLRTDRAELKRSFISLKSAQERSWTDWQQARLIDMKARWDRSKVWEANLWSLLHKTEETLELELPVRPLLPA